MLIGRLLFLDQTLQGMIQRFEDEYPETRLQPSDAASTTSSKLSSSPPTSAVPTLENSVSTDFTAAESDEDEPSTLRSRNNSDVSLASRHMSLEEGRLHRFAIAYAPVFSTRHVPRLPTSPRITSPSSQVRQMTKAFPNTFSPCARTSRTTVVTR